MQVCDVVMVAVFQVSRSNCCYRYRRRSRQRYRRRGRCASVGAFVFCPHFSEVQETHHAPKFLLSSILQMLRRNSTLLLAHLSQEKGGAGEDSRPCFVEIRAIAVFVQAAQVANVSMFPPSAASSNNSQTLAFSISAPSSSYMQTRVLIAYMFPPSTARSYNSK